MTARHSNRLHSAGSGYDSYGARAGIAPGVHLVGLKVPDAQGAGHISDVIAALDWVVDDHAACNIRVVNLSVGAAVTESDMFGASAYTSLFESDPPPSTGGNPPPGCSSTTWAITDPLTGLVTETTTTTCTTTTGGGY